MKIFIQYRTAHHPQIIVGFQADPSVFKFCTVQVLTFYYAHARACAFFIVKFVLFLKHLFLKVAKSFRLSRKRFLFVVVFIQFVQDLPIVLFLKAPQWLRLNSFVRAKLQVALLTMRFLHPFL